MRQLEVIRLLAAHGPGTIPDIVAKLIQAERFYVSMGFPVLNETFWKRSDLYPAEKGRKKNTHATAWHMNLADDCRSIMSLEPNAEWFGTAHHELGHIYYYMSYSNPDVPLLLRDSANRGYGEGIGELIELACFQRPYLQEVGLLQSDTQVDEMAWLLNDALDSVVFLQFAAGTMSHFEHDFYEQDLPASQFNARWWEYVKKFQGILPPSSRGEEYCDAATRTHINDDPAQYYDYALATVLKFHLHDYICRTFLKQNPRAANYYGSTKVGEFLKSILSPGRSMDWRRLLREKTGQDLSAQAMLEYYRPLQDYLRKVNAGRKYTMD